MSCCHNRQPRLPCQLDQTKRGGHPPPPAVGRGRPSRSRGSRAVGGSQSEAPQEELVRPWGAHEAQAGVHRRGVWPVMGGPDRVECAGKARLPLGIVLASGGVEVVREVPVGVEAVGVAVARVAAECAKAGERKQEARSSGPGLWTPVQQACSANSSLLVLPLARLLTRVQETAHTRQIRCRRHVDSDESRDVTQFRCAGEIAQSFPDVLCVRLVE